MRLLIRFSKAKRSQRKHSVRSRRPRLRRRFLFVEELESRRVMANFEVTILQDAINPIDEGLSLREAIFYSNMSPGPDTITFAKSLTENRETIDLVGGELAVKETVEIIGPDSANLTINAGGRSRIFNINDENGVTQSVTKLSNLILNGGNGDLGGAILNNDALIIVGCTFENNRAMFGGAIYSQGSLSVWESLFAENLAVQNGGAISATSALSLVDSTFFGNEALHAGGAIGYSGPATGLSAVQYAGQNNATIYFFTMINCTIVGNEAGTTGGGVWGDYTNTASPAITATFVNNLMAGNRLVNGAADDLAGVWNWEAWNNLLGADGTSGWLSQPSFNHKLESNIIGVDWKSVVENDGTHAILKDNGGRSKTVALTLFSPAIDNGDVTYFAAVASRNDQRGPGFPRWARNNVDIGAYEMPKMKTEIRLDAWGPKSSDGLIIYMAKGSYEDTNPLHGEKVAFYVEYLKDGKWAQEKVGEAKAESGYAFLHFNSAGYGVYRIVAVVVEGLRCQGSYSNRVTGFSDGVDFGDAPNASQSSSTNGYPVSLLHDGAFHSTRFSTLALGSNRSSETDGQPSSQADADIGDDGVALLTPLLVGTTDGDAALSVTLPRGLNSESIAGRLDGWIDFNHDGDWDDSGEKIYDSVTVVSGANVLGFSVPAGAPAGKTAARFRLSTLGGLSPRGPAFDGEVEDYLLAFRSDPSPSPLSIADTIGNQIKKIVLTEGDLVVSDNVNRTLFRAPAALFTKLLISRTTNEAFSADGVPLRLNGTAEILMGTEKLEVKLLGANQSLAIGPDSAVPWRHATSVEIDISGAGKNSLTVGAVSGRLRIVDDGDDAIMGEGFRGRVPTTLGGKFVHRFDPKSSGDASPGSVELVNKNPNNNPLNRFDVDGNASADAIDVLVTINALSRLGTTTLAMSAPPSASNENWKYFDVDGDGGLSPIDVLMLINHLNRRGASEGESGAITKTFFGSGNLFLNGYTWNFTDNYTNNVYIPPPPSGPRPLVKTSDVTAIQMAGVLEKDKNTSRASMFLSDTFLPVNWYTVYDKAISTTRDNAKLFFGSGASMYRPLMVLEYTIFVGRNFY